jgi:heme/copper-type cytochrome/quinol oxidase subunit 2
VKPLAAALFASIVCIAGCGTTAQFAAIPPDLDRTKVQHVTMDIKAQRYEFIPDVIRVKAGTLVTLRVTAVDGTHGFALGDFGIDELLEEGQVKVIEFYAPRLGEYGFHCSHLCGIGHFGMSGRVVVE